MTQAKRAKSRPSPETQAEAERIANATQRPGQTKEQTRLIAQGVQKGIDEYKKQQKARARAADKARKQRQKAQASEFSETEFTETERALPSSPRASIAWLPWLLLIASWIGFAIFYWQLMHAR